MARDLPEPLFRQYDLRRTLDAQLPEIHKAVDEYSADALAQESDDELVAHLVGRFWVEVPVLTEGATSVAAEEVEVDVSGDRNRDIRDRNVPFYMPGFEVTYYVPFTGDANLFKFVPSSRDFNPPRADIVGEELRFRYTRTDSDVAATKTDFERELAKVRQYLGWISSDASMYNSTLDDKIRQKIVERRGRLEKARAGMQSLGIPLRSAQQPGPPPRPSATPRTRAKRPTAETPNYDVALSFAGENRAYVERVAEILKQSGVNVFYDKFETAILWGKNLVDHLADIYQHRSRFVVMFISKHYVEKAFPKHERQHAQARALVAKEEYILPARFDDTEVPGLASTVAYTDLRNLSGEELADLILAKVGRKR